MVACGNGFPADGRTDLFTPENTGKSHNRHVAVVSLLLEWRNVAIFLAPHVVRLST
ncbi:hypothetical protein HC006_24150, partial [Escherichia coli]|uniref:Uncharacterized protein n=3 Tax=Escherichia coli TaxID=562 RepID=B7LIJ4_ECO81|nr:hypothetical protein [Escherichia coli]NJB22697.1 hypothetical protein [Escherichia coli]CAQ87262.1 hypothetical protein, putative ankyrin domain [Escherichia coli ED1a]